MKALKVFLFFFVLLIVVSSNSNAQKAFPTEHDKFAKEFSSFLNYTGEIRDKGKGMEKEFISFWESDSLIPEYKNQFINTAQRIKGKGCAGYPIYVYFTAITMDFVRKKIPWDQYELYENELIKILSQQRLKTKEINELQKITYDLIAKNTIYESPRAVWKISTSDYSLMKSEGSEAFMIHVNNTDLCGYYGKDSVKIQNTYGIVNPFRNTWDGKGGKVTWERVGMNPDTIYAELTNYSVNLREAKYIADSVVFVNSIYFKEPLFGQLVDNTVNLDNPSRSSYPRFTSYEQHFEIEDLVEGVNYEGGFSMVGKLFVGSGNSENPARLNIVKNDTVSLDAFSERFLLESNSIFSENTRVILRLSQDSIYHPNLTFKYSEKLKLLELIRTKEGMSKVNFTNTYHKVNMDVTWIRWFIDKYSIDFTMYQTPGHPNQISLESVDYYREERYKEIKMQDARNPLEILSEYVGYSGSPEFYASDLAAYMKFSPAQVKQMLLRVAYLGFIFYDPDKEYVLVKPEVWDFVSAHKGTKDSDVLQFYSQTPSDTTNATLSLLNFDIKMRGVPNVHVSDSQKVSIYPIDKKITLKKGRTFVMNGTVQAGQFYFYGTNFKFDYDNFKIDLNQCDSMKMVAETDVLDALGRRKPAIVRNKIENLSGEFFIDNPQNKAGREDYEEFPKFTCKRKSYVYYDDKSIYKGVYDRRRFKFEIDPFTLDSIEGLNPDNLVFKGRLITDIFPDIEETLVLRSDFSLGFQTYTDKNGLPIYGDKAKYTNLIDLSNEGLRGKGSIEYLTSVTEMDYLIFFPDSLQGHAETFDIHKQKYPIEYPAVKGKDNDINWSVVDDNFYVYQDTVNFDMFEGQLIHKGYLNLTSHGLEGAGEATIERSVLKSNLFTYKQDIIEADTSNFSLFTETKLNIDFKSDNVKSKIDFIERKGTFRSNGEQSKWEFPKNKYISIMDELTWYLDKTEIEISASDDVIAKYERDKEKLSPAELEELFLAGPKFISVHPDQDSLEFVAPRARFNYVDHIIYAEDVDFIRVADATIYTSDGNVTVKKNADMQTLKKTEIIANRTTRYHKIYDADVTITGRNKYTGNGYYDYIDVAGRKQQVVLNSISTDVTNQTIATGTITESDNFKISPYFKYQGQIFLEASRKHFEFKGAAQVVSRCDSLETDWVRFSAVLDPANIYLPIGDKPRSINNQKLFAGLYMSSFGKLEPYFFKRLLRDDDTPIFAAEGDLHYSEKENLFKFGPRDKLDEISLPGNYIELDNKDCNIYGEGKFELSGHFGQFYPNAIGYFEYNPETDSVDLLVDMLMQFHFSQDAFKRMADLINVTPGLMGLELGSKTYQNSLVEYLGIEKAEEWFAQLSLGNLNKYPKELEELFILANIDLEWQQYNGAYVYYGPIGIANAGKYQINKYVYGYLIIERSRRRVSLELLLEVDNKTYFYFNYKGGFLSVYSSDTEFNQIIYDTKEGSRYIKAKDNLPAFGYGATSEGSVKTFKRNLKRKYGVDIEADEE
jgi:hypothetical protein